MSGHGMAACGKANSGQNIDVSYVPFPDSCTAAIATSFDHLGRRARAAPVGMFRLSALAVLRLMTSSKFRRLLDRKVRRLCDFEDLQLPWPSTTPGCEPAARCRGT